MTIVEAIRRVMVAAGRPLTPKEAYDAIIEGGLYEFHAQQPEHVVRTQIRRHLMDVDFPSSATKKHFRVEGRNKYSALVVPKPHALPKSERSASHGPAPAAAPDSPDKALNQLQDLHREYVARTKEMALNHLRSLTPSLFEDFGRQLMDAYGFVGTCVTQVSNDGGIDGHGRLRVGLADLNVAFQCKRWSKGNIQRPEIDRFRGASQGQFEQGIFSTTSSFSRGAIGASIRHGAIPIVLVDGESIVDLMLSRHMGFQVEVLELPIFALDLVFSGDAP